MDKVENVSNTPRPKLFFFFFFFFSLSLFLCELAGGEKGEIYCLIIIFILVIEGGRPVLLE